jgi:hypothetical protein
VRTGLCGHENAREDRNTPAPRHHQESTVVALGAFERNVCHDTATQQGQHHGSEYFGKENNSKRHL